jgi:hypothetical protein
MLCHPRAKETIDFMGIVKCGFFTAFTSPPDTVEQLETARWILCYLPVVVSAILWVHTMGRRHGGGQKARHRWSEQYVLGAGACASASPSRPDLTAIFSLDDTLPTARLKASHQPCKGSDQHYCSDPLQSPTRTELHCNL